MTALRASWNWQAEAQDKLDAIVSGLERHADQPLDAAWAKAATAALKGALKAAKATHIKVTPLRDDQCAGLAEGGGQGTCQPDRLPGAANRTENEVIV